MPSRPRNRKKPRLRETTVTHNSVFAAHRLKCRPRNLSGPAFPFLNNADDPLCVSYGAARADFADIFGSGRRRTAEESLWGAHAPRVLANAPSRWRTSSTCFSLNSQPHVTP